MHQTDGLGRETIDNTVRIWEVEYHVGVRLCLFIAPWMLEVLQRVVACGEIVICVGEVPSCASLVEKFGRKTLLVAWT